MILVSGATGTIGSDVVRRLDALGQPVRALTRDPARAAAPAGVEVVRGDLDDPVSLAVAVRSVSTVLLLAPPGPRQAEHDLALLAAARDGGVDRVVKLSAIGTGLASHPKMGEWHQPGEEAVRASGLEWTILRPTSFASNTLAWVGAISAGEPVPNPFGAGEQAVVDPRDVAAVAVQALTGTGHSGQTYTLTGPSALTTREQTAVIGAVLGRDVHILELTLDEWRAMLVESGADAAFIDKVVDGVTFVRKGLNAAVTDDVYRM
jgi:uncharacterized protein YbjT (DUF2867 family)